MDFNRDKIKCSCGAKYLFDLEDTDFDLCNECLKEKARNEISLNRFALDEHAESQPLMVEKWGQAFLTMKDLVVVIEAKIRGAKADVDSEIRALSETDLEVEYGTKKVTEGFINSVAEKNPKIKELNSYLRDAMRRRDILGGTVNSLKDRTSMIKVISELYKSEYFTTVGSEKAQRSDRSSLSSSERIGKSVRVPRGKR